MTAAPGGTVRSRGARVRREQRGAVVGRVAPGLPGDEAWEVLGRVLRENGFRHVHEPPPVDGVRFAQWVPVWPDGVVAGEMVWASLAVSGELRVAMRGDTRPAGRLGALASRRLQRVARTADRLEEARRVLADEHGFEV